MPESKTIEAAINLVNARFGISEGGFYYLKNTNNEEHVINCIADLRKALIVEGHISKLQNME